MSSWVDFSIGPVQRFIAQARRTRDLWGGSYLLSYLSGCAMMEAEKAGAKIVRPFVSEDPMYKRLVQGKGVGPSEDGPLTGGVPNHFVVECKGDPAEVARACEKAVKQAWLRIAEAVWKNFVADAVHLGHGTREIWERQVEDPWEIAWAVSSEPTRGMLYRRKRWRTHALPDEPGDKCMVMPDYQEISGYVRARDRRKQDAFWAKVREKTGPFDVREDERLCSLTLIKRLFGRVAKEAIGWSLDVSSWPSTLHMAGLPWTVAAMEKAPDASSEFFKAAKEKSQGGAISSAPEPFGRWRKGQGANLFSVDPNLFYRSFLEGSPDDGAYKWLKEPGASKYLLEQLERLVARLEATSRKPGWPTFYAVLLADGDRIGDAVANLGPERLGKALARFSSEARRIIESEFGGTVVYAGGDDLLAMLPVVSVGEFSGKSAREATVLDCAHALSRAYKDAFLEEGVEGTRKPGEHPAEPSDPDQSSSDGWRPSLSTGIAIAHMRLPMGQVLDEARRLLDEVAKDQNGRDSFALGVIRRGGLACQWTACWQAEDALKAFSELVSRLRGGHASRVSMSLAHRIADLLVRLRGGGEWKPGEVLAVGEGLDLEALLEAVVAESLEHLEGRGALGGYQGEEVAVAKLLVETMHTRYGGRAVNRIEGLRLDPIVFAEFIATEQFKEDPNERL